MVVTYVFADIPSDRIRVQVRCRNLADAINRTGSHRANLLDISSFVRNTPLAQKLCGEADLIIVYRYLLGAVLTAVQYWKARDKKVIVDFDQALNYLPKTHPAYSFWMEGVPLNDLMLDIISFMDAPPIEQFKWGLGMVDAATVSSIRLVDDWGRFTAVYKVLDYINTSHYPSAIQTHEDTVWMGIGSRVDFSCLKGSGLLRAVEKVCHNHPHVNLILFGMQADAMQIQIDSRQLRVYESSSFEDWVDILLRMNIGLMPMYTQYDLRLGTYDLLEFMISKIPWIASEEPTFHNLSSYGQWVRNTPEAWENAIINTLRQYPTCTKESAREPFLFALNQDVSVNIGRVLAVYSSITGR